MSAIEQPKLESTLTTAGAPPVGPADSSVRLSLVVPFHRGLGFLQQCLEAITPLPAGWELIIVADGPVDDCGALAARFGARLLTIAGPQGPAVARNRAAEIATGDVLVFIDADVVASTTVLRHVARIFEGSPETTAVFGAYDDRPGDAGFISQYKNLAHSYIHQMSAGAAQTFWAGFGAVRRDVFLSIAGFDERFARPSVEDIDLGYRLTAAGFRVVLDPSLNVCHLKKWTLASMIASDVRDRGIPWTQLILRFGRFNSDLNLKQSYRVCVVLAYLALVALTLSMFEPKLALTVPFFIGGLVLLSRSYYEYFYRQRGLWFVLRVFPLHYLYHLYNGLSFMTGSVLYGATHVGLRLPGALPTGTWGDLEPASLERHTEPARRVALKFSGGDR